jgi:hypothetical protein
MGLVEGHINLRMIREVTILLPTQAIDIVGGSSLVRVSPTCKMREHVRVIELVKSRLGVL